MIYVVIEMVDGDPRGVGAFPDWASAEEGIDDYLRPMAKELDEDEGEPPGDYSSGEKLRERMDFVRMEILPMDLHSKRNNPETPLDTKLKSKLLR